MHCKKNLQTKVTHFLLFKKQLELINIIILFFVLGIGTVLKIENSADIFCSVPQPACGPTQGRH